MSSFTITYRDPVDGEVVRLRARQVGDSSLGLAFVCIADFVFDSKRIVDPKEEALARRLEGTRRLHLNLYAILSIEERGDDELVLGDRSKVLLLRPPGTSD